SGGGRFDAGATGGGWFHRSQSGAGGGLHRLDRHRVCAPGAHGRVDLHQVPHLRQNSHGATPPLLDCRLLRTQRARRNDGHGSPSGLLVFLAPAPVRGTRQRAQVGDGFPGSERVVRFYCGPRRQRFSRGRIMTQTLDAGEGLPGSDAPAAKGAPTSTVKTGAKLGTFAITFGIAFALLYTVYERLNWPLFTYHPVLGNLDFGRQPTGVGPPMFW